MALFPKWQAEKLNIYRTGKLQMSESTVNIQLMPKEQDDDLHELTFQQQHMVDDLWILLSQPTDQEESALQKP